MLGVAYKKDVDDPRESPAFELMELLLARRGGGHLQRSARAAAAADAAPQRPAWRASPLTPEYLAAQDCVLIATDHSAYDYEFVVRHATLVIDTRNAAKKVAVGREKIVKA